MYQQIFTQDDIDFLSEAQLQYTINASGCSVKIENQSKYAVDVYNNQQQVDRINPYSFLVVPNGDYQIKVNKAIKSTNAQPYNFISYKTVTQEVKTESGSTTFTGTATVNGDMNVTGGQIDAYVKGDINLAAGTKVEANIQNAKIDTEVINTMLNVNNFAKIGSDTKTTTSATTLRLYPTITTSNIGVFDNIIFVLKGTKTNLDTGATSPLDIEQVNIVGTYLNKVSTKNTLNIGVLRYPDSTINKDYVVVDGSFVVEEPLDRIDLQIKIPDTWHTGGNEEAKVYIQAFGYNADQKKIFAQNFTYDPIGKNWQVKLGAHSFDTLRVGAVTSDYVSDAHHTVGWFTTKGFKGLSIHFYYNSATYRPILDIYGRDPVSDTHDLIIFDQQNPNWGINDTPLTTGVHYVWTFYPSLETKQLTHDSDRAYQFNMAIPEEIRIRFRDPRGGNGYAVDSMKITISLLE